MFTVRYAEPADFPFWFKLDKHLTQKEFFKKIQNKECYILLKDLLPVGILRYNLFWDEIPFCNLLFISPAFQRMGGGKSFMQFWEADMQNKGYELVLTSSQSDESAQHFYRKLGYQDCGGLRIPTGKYAQPMEIFFLKFL